MEAARSLIGLMIDSNTEEDGEHRKMASDEILRAMSYAGVPMNYQDPELSIMEQGKIGTRLGLWLRTGGAKGISKKGRVIEVVGSESSTCDAFYMFIRALVIRRVPVVALDCDVLWSIIESGSPLEDDRLDGRGVLAIDGLITEKRLPFTAEQMARIEWFLLRWLSTGKSIIMLNDLPFVTEEKRPESNPFSSRFINRLKPRQVFIT